MSTSEVELTQEWSSYADPLDYPTRQYVPPSYSNKGIHKPSLSTVSSHPSTTPTSPSSGGGDMTDDAIEDAIVAEQSTTAESARARPIMRRSFSSTVSSTPQTTSTAKCYAPTSTTSSESQSSQYVTSGSTTVGRHSRHSTLTRSSVYASGTQSAYGSRDTSPDKYYRFKKLSPYPVPPPSFIVTPPRTPVGKVSAPQLLTSENMAKLYEKLGAIENQDDDSEGRLSPVEIFKGIVFVFLE